MKKLLNILFDAFPAILLVGGAWGIAYGVWCIYAPAGYITGGLLAIIFGVLLILGGTHEPTE